MSAPSVLAEEGRVLRLSRAASSWPGVGVGDRALAEVALGAIDRLAARICRPLIVELQTVMRGPAGARLPGPSTTHLLHAPELDGAAARRAARLADSAMSTASIDLSAPVLDAWLARACARSGSDEEEAPAGWLLISLTATSARLPEESASGGLVRLRTDGGERLLRVAQSDGGAWVAAPPGDPWVPSPIVVSLYNDGGALTLILAVRWSIWEAHTPGGALLDAAIRALVDSGWHFDSDTSLFA